MRLIGALGRTYQDGECIVRQSEVGDCMYIVQGGKVEVVVGDPGDETRLAELGAGEVFGEMALFTRTPRSATVRACGKARVLSVDKRGLLKRIHEDPSLAFGILRKMSQRIRALDNEVSRLTRLARDPSPPGNADESGNGQS